MAVTVVISKWISMTFLAVSEAMWNCEQTAHIKKAIHPQNKAVKNGVRDEGIRTPLEATRGAK